jgi:hypothetical protein
MKWPVAGGQWPVSTWPFKITMRAITANSARTPFSGLLWPLTTGHWPLP